MRESSIAAQFQFKSFKVDRFKFSSKQKLSLLARLEGFAPDEWDIKFRFRTPMYFKKPKIYIGGLDMLVSIPESDQESEKSQGDERDSLISLDAGIAGVFTVDDDFDKKDEEVLVKIQIPALLLPYLRGTITSYLANAGYGTLVFPLINIHAVAKDALKDVEVIVVDE